METQTKSAGIAAGNNSAALEVANSGLEQAAAVYEGPGILAKQPAIALLPVEVDVAIPIRSFRVRNLVSLAEGQVVETHWIQGDDMPLAARGAQLAWTEFEVIDSKLAVRITRLA